MKYFSYIDSREYLKKFQIQSSHDFYRMVREGSFDERINKRPYEYFRTKKRNDWVSWKDFLSLSDVRKEKYLEFEEARKIVRTLGIKSQFEWNNWCKGEERKNLKIPTNPRVYYKESGWVSLSDWLGNTSYKNLANVSYLNYRECKRYITSNFPEIKNRNYWIKFDKRKLPIFIPKRPDHIYKKSGDWINWESFLDSKISPRSKSKKIMPFEEAKEYIKSLKFMDQYEFHRFIEENKIEFIPKRPDYVYKENWKGYLDFLGCESNKESIGERLIRTYLLENNILFEKEKRFKTCKNINELPFDFYLPEYNLCIEYDGELHYKSSAKYGGEKNLKRQIKHDKIKTNWCRLNSVRLLRISYLKKNKIFKILKSEIY